MNQIRFGTIANFGGSQALTNQPTPNLNNNAVASANLAVDEFIFNSSNDVLTTLQAPRSLGQLQNGASPVASSFVIDL